MSQQCDLNVIMHSKRANIFYLEHCRVMQKDGVVVFLTELKNSNAYYNIPIANTTFLLLGEGTSISQAAQKQAYLLGFVVGKEPRCMRGQKFNGLLHKTIIANRNTCSNGLQCGVIKQND